MLPPPVVLTVSTAVPAMGKLMVSRAAPRLVRPPVSVMESLVKVKALAPLLNVMPATLKPERLLFSVVPEIPAAPNTQESPLMGGLFAPVQLASAKLMLPLPTHVSAPFAADARGAASSATAAAAAAIVLTMPAIDADENSEVIEVFCCVFEFIGLVC